jgi:acyl dehydratase
MTGEALLYFEDLTPGRRFESARRAVAAGEIKAFARDFDPQPFHTDEAAAAASFFGGLAASGWHTAALTMRLMVEALPVAGGLIGAGGEIAWPRPTRPGDELRIVVTVESATPSRSRPDRGSVVIRTETLNQAGEPVQVLTARLVVPRRG